MVMDKPNDTFIRYTVSFASLLLHSLNGNVSSYILVGSIACYLAFDNNINTHHLSQFLQLF
jgi:hypothetical protein